MEEWKKEGTRLYRTIEPDNPFIHRPLLLSSSLLTFQTFHRIHQRCFYTLKTYCQQCNRNGDQTC